MDKRVKYGIFGGLALVFFCLVLVFYLPDCFGGEKTKAFKLENWSRSIKGQEDRIVTLPEKLFRRDGEMVKIHTYLPEAFEKTQTICFWTDFQEVSVYLEEELIYTNVGDGRYFGKAHISQWNYVEIPEHSNDKKLLICLQTPYKSFEYELEEVLYGSSEEIAAWIHENYGMNQILDYLLIGVGVLFFVFTFARSRDLRYRLCQFFFGTTAILFGLWLRTSMKGIASYGVGEGLAFLMGKVALFLIPVTLTMYVKIRAIKIKQLSMVCDIMIVVELLTAIVVFLLQVLGIKDIQEVVVVGEILILISAVWAVCVAAVYYTTRNARISILTVINAYLLVIAIMAEYMNYNNVNISFLRFDIIIRMCVVAIIVLETYMFLEHLRKNEEMQLLTERENKNLQINLLTNDVRPHFILNTLGAIRSMIRRNPEQAYELLYDFSKYIRKNMEKKDYSKKVPFLEEMDYIETYLKLEQLRFEDRIQVIFDIQIHDFWILPLSIQPFVENAVKHGLLAKKEGGHIWITTKELEKEIQIIVQDDGVGFDTKAFWKEIGEIKSIGLKSSLFRLENDMNAVCKMESSMEPENSGTYIEIRIPKKEVTKDENNNRRR